MSDRPYVSFAECKQQISFPDVLNAFGLTGFKVSAKLVSGVCPLPSHEHGPNPNPEQFKAHLKDGVWLWKCFSPECNQGGDVVEFVKAMTGHGNAHVRFWFATNFGDRLTLSKPTTPPAEDSANKLKEATSDIAAKRHSKEASVEKPIIHSLPDPLKPLSFRLKLDPDVSYLHERGLSDETIQRFGLGLCRRGQLKGYIAIPCFNWQADESENPVGYVGRWPNEHFADHGKTRYKVPEGFRTSQIVYGLREAMSSGDASEPLIIVEGALKALHLFQAGYRRAVSTLTAFVSDEQAAILAATQSPIVLMFDGNDGGRDGMRLAAAKLITKTFVRVVSLADDTEPDDLSPAELNNVLSFLPR